MRHQDLTRRIGADLQPQGTTVMTCCLLPLPDQITRPTAAFLPTKAGRERKRAQILSPQVSGPAASRCGSEKAICCGGRTIRYISSPATTPVEISLSASPRLRDRAQPIAESGDSERTIVTKGNPIDPKGAVRPLSLQPVELPSQFQMIAGIRRNMRGMLRRAIPAMTE